MNREIYRRIVAGETLTATLSPRALWRLSGPDAPRYLNGQVTNDITPLRESQGCYAAVCTAKGRMEGDLFIARHGDDFYLEAVAELRESLGARLEKYLVADDAVLEDISNQWSLSHVFGANPPPAPELGFVVPHARFGVPGHDVWVAAPGAVIIGDSVDAITIETLRLDHGLPRWGAELTPTTLPPEAGPRLIDAISYTKGCYVGQEVIARLKSVGHVNRTLVFLLSSSAGFPVPGAKLVRDEKEVGVVTSSGFSPRLECGVALGYVQLALAVEKSEFQSGDLTMTLTSPPSL